MFFLMGDMGSMAPPVSDCDPAFIFGVIVGVAAAIFLLLSIFYIGRPK